MLPMLPSIGVSIENDVGKTSFASYEKNLSGKQNIAKTCCIYSVMKTFLLV